MPTVIPRSSHKNVIYMVNPASITNNEYGALCVFHNIYIIPICNTYNRLKNVWLLVLDWWVLAVGGKYSSISYSVFLFLYIDTNIITTAFS